MRYEAPKSVPEAVQMLADARGRVHVLAGGTDLIVRMKSGHVEPDVVIDIKRIKDLQQLRKNSAGTSIGAAVSCRTLGRHRTVGKAWPGVVEAACLIGSDQIQGRCTVSGNLCNASPAADTVPALIAADASVQIVGPDGERGVPVEDFLKGPGKSILKKAEMVTSIELPPRRTRQADAYLRFTPRTEMDIAVVSAAVNLTLDREHVICEARVALGAVAATAIRVPAAEQALIGNTLDEQTLQALAEACSAACKPINDKRGTVEYRTRVAGVLAKRAAQAAFTRAGGEA